MYMMAFVTLMVALIGMYAQIYVKIAARGFEQHSGIVDSMRVWHDTATELGSKSDKSRIDGLSSYCSLTFVPPGNGVPVDMANHCSQGGIADVADVYVARQESPAFSYGFSDYLPAGYSETYVYYSIAFRVTGTTNRYYVLTYVPRPATGSDLYGVGLLCLPGNGSGNLTTTCTGSHKQIHTTFNALYKQLKNNKSIPITSYGVVSSDGELSTQAIEQETWDTSTPGGVKIVNQPFTYAVPSEDSGVPVGSIGIITEITPK